MREIVDILRRAGEMDEFDNLRDFGNAGKPLLQPIFDRLDVVVGRALDRLDALGVGGEERRSRLVQECPRRGRKRRDLGDAGFVGQRLEPGKLDFDAIADEPVFAEVLGEGGELLAVASVQRA